MVTPDLTPMLPPSSLTTRCCHPSLPQNSIDLDQQGIQDALDLGANGFVQAKEIFFNGGLSLDTTPPIRSIAGFSTSAEKKMYNGCPGCPYKDYSYAYDYYGEFDYANQIVVAALDGTVTNLANGNIDMRASTLVGREEVAKKGTVVLNVFQYVLREFEDALDDCQSNCIKCNDGPVHAWDEGVAFYTGSLEGTDGSGSGNLLYALADKRCQNFGTCGVDKDFLDGTAGVNHELFQQFALGNYQLLTGDCSAARVTKERVAELMYVPVIQGTLRYAYKMENLQGGEKENAEGAIFAAAVLPKVAAFDEDAARTIYSNIRMGAPSTDAVAVKKAFESVYKEMGITCADVGGLWNTGTADYYTDYEPCKDKSTKTMNAQTGVIVGSVRGARVIILFAGMIFIRSKEKAGKPVFVSN